MAKDTKSARANKERSPYGARLLSARKEKGLTQTELAKLAACPISTIAEAETTGAGSTYTAQLAHVLGVNALWLATGDGAREATKPLEAPRSPFADLSAEESALLSVMRIGLTHKEMSQLATSVEEAVKLRVAQGAATHDLSFYFAVDRRNHTVDVVHDKREKKSWNVSSGDSPELRQVTAKKMGVSK